MGEFSCLFVGIALAFLAAVIFNFKQIGYHSGTSPANGCINNLRQIDAATQEFALEKGETNGEAINYPNDLTPYIKLDKAAKCLHVRKAAFIPSRKSAMLRPAHSAPPSTRPTFCPEPRSGNQSRPQ